MRGEEVGGGTPDTKNNSYWNGDINWFTPTEIKQREAKSSLRKITESGLKNSSARLLPIGTLLFTSRATIGKIAITTSISSTNQGFQSFVVNRFNSNTFLYYWLILNKFEFIKHANGSTFLEISGNVVRKMKGSFPTLPEQQKIASFLTSVDEYL
ncbi:MAG: restriction endonuclease subunit S [Candidatus Dojkabacteria bacterium]|nr:restriction endonuclease subunit S [Candidatus Dojkabacteria bacterium]MDQ7020763.1 restriction endonuclease subunit S [Candidatus Dojkabacteria bacterium]